MTSSRVLTLDLGIEDERSPAPHFGKPQQQLSGVNLTVDLNYETQALSALVVDMYICQWK